MSAYKWQPLEGLDTHTSSMDFQEIDSLHQKWLRFNKQREESNPDVFMAFFGSLGLSLGD